MSPPCDHDGHTTADYTAVDTLERAYQRAGWDSPEPSMVRRRDRDGKCEYDYGDGWADSPECAVALSDTTLSAHVDG